MNVTAYEHLRVTGMGLWGGVRTLAVTFKGGPVNTILRLILTSTFGRRSVVERQRGQRSFERGQKGLPWAREKATLSSERRVVRRCHPNSQLKPQAPLHAQPGCVPGCVCVGHQLGLGLPRARLLPSITHLQQGLLPEAERLCAHRAHQGSVQRRQAPPHKSALEDREHVLELHIVLEFPLLR
eukprot:5665835-Pyramimonas_sp.AAC.1